VIENVVVQTIRRQNVAPVVALIERPVIAEALGAEDKNAVVAQLVILDDRQRLESFAKADAIGNDAAAEAFQLVERADNTIALKLVELLPDHRVANAGG